MAISQGKFPKPIKLGLRSIGWLGEEIEEWVRQRVELSRVRHDRRSRCISISRSPCWAGQMGGEVPSAPGSQPIPKHRGGARRRTLRRCWAGCATADVLKSLGLSMGDLYAGPPPSPAQARQLAAERARRDAETLAQRQVFRSACDRVRKLYAVVDALGTWLAHLPDDASGSQRTGIPISSPSNFI